MSSRSPMSPDGSSDFSADSSRRKCGSSAHTALPFHGVGLFQQIDRVQRLVWSLALCVIAALALFYTYHVLDEFFDYQTVTHLTVRQNASLLLPSVHVCPKNPDSLNYDVLFSDIEATLGQLAFESKKDILLYFIASCGFINTNVNLWTTERTSSVGHLVDRWMGRRSMVEMFQFVFDENGLECDDILADCVTMNCCERFRPHYVMLRGRCMRLDHQYQNGSGEPSAVRLNFKKPGGLLIDGAEQRQLVVYLGDEWPEVGIFPRVYITENDFAEAMLRLRKVKMMSRGGMCSTNPHERGRATCYVNRWLRENLIVPFNCTIPSMRWLRAAQGYDVCDPHLIVANYHSLINSASLKKKCDLNCDRWELTIAYSTSVKRYPGIFRLNIYYGDMSHEEYEEIAMLSMPRFISQVGGQLGLFLGVSVISLIHLLRMLSLKSYHAYKQTVVSNGVPK